MLLFPCNKIVNYAVLGGLFVRHPLGICAGVELGINDTFMSFLTSAGLANYLFRA